MSRTMTIQAPAKTRRRSTASSTGPMRRITRMGPCYNASRRLLLHAAPMLAVLVAASSTARAQISIYGTFSEDRVSNAVNGTAPGSGYTYGSFSNPGFGGGITLTVLPLGPVSLGLDLRGSAHTGTPGDDTALGGVKLAVHLPLISLKPYLQASGGYLRTRTPAVVNLAPITATRGFAVYEILGGIDTRLLPLLDLRIIEIGAGQGTQISGPNSDAGKPSLLTINTGLVFHF